jgi:hypothetical protein
VARRDRRHGRQDSSSIVAQTGLRASALSICFVCWTRRATGSPASVRFPGEYRPPKRYSSRTKAKPPVFAWPTALLLWCFVSLTDQGGGKRRGSFSDIDFSKSESFYERPAYWPSTIQNIVELDAMKTSAFGEGRNTSLAIDGLPQQLDNVGIIEKAPVLSKIAAC